MKNKQMKNKVTATHNSKMAFELDVNGHKFFIDADEKVGGEDKGPRPKPLMLAALSGCTAMDVISILKKMRIEPDYFNVSVEGDLTEEYPKQYNKMHVVYEFKGKDLPIEKLQKAINLSEDRYCGVSALYKKVIPISSEIKILE